MKPLTIDSVKAAMTAKKYIINSADAQVNIVGIRSCNPIPNTFADQMCIFWTYQDKDYFYTYTCTTDPGSYWLKYPMVKEGTACVKEGQYLDVFCIGNFRGEYQALIQQKYLTIIRELKRDGSCEIKIPDLSGCIKSTRIGELHDQVTDWTDSSGNLIWRESTGNMYGICIHHAVNGGTSYLDNNWSAGCQVFANDSKDFPEFMNFCQASEKLNGNNFTYTLLNENDL